MNRIVCSALVLSVAALTACSAEGTGDPLENGTPAASTTPAPEKSNDETPASETAAANAPADVADDSLDVEARSWGVKVGVSVNGHTTSLAASRTVELSLADGTRTVDGIIEVEGPLGASVKIERNKEQFANTTPGDHIVELGASTTWTVTVIGPLGRKWGGRPWSYSYNFKVQAGQD